MKKELLFHQHSNKHLIEVWQDGGVRRLFINSVEQTRMHTQCVTHLLAPPNRAFLSCLLFTETPQTVLLAGSGGGELARYLHHQKPCMKGIAVEIDSVVAQISNEYFQFPQKNWELIIDDVRNIKEGNYDLIVADIAEDKLTPAWLTEAQMIKQLKQQLSGCGVLTMNLLVSDAQSFTKILQTLRHYFAKRILCLSIHGHKNIIVFAFNNAPKYHITEQISKRLSNIKRDWGLDFSAELSQLQTDNPVGSGIF